MFYGQARALFRDSHVLDHKNWKTGAWRRCAGEHAAGDGECGRGPYATARMDYLSAANPLLISILGQ